MECHCSSIIGVKIAFRQQSQMENKRRFSSNDKLKMIKGAVWNQDILTF